MLSKFGLPFDKGTPLVHFPKALKRPRNNAGPASYDYYYYCTPSFLYYYLLFIIMFFIGHTIVLFCISSLTQVSKDRFFKSSHPPPPTATTVLSIIAMCKQIIAKFWTVGMQAQLTALILDAHSLHTWHSKHTLHGRFYWPYGPSFLFVHTCMGYACVCAGMCTQ